MTSLLTLTFILLVILAVAAFALSKWMAARTGLPAGRLIYSDTGFAVGKVSALERNQQGEKVEKPLRSRRYGLVGRPDYLVKTDKGIIPVEAKSAKCPPSGRPHDSHLFQLTSYCLLVEDVLGGTVPYGVLRYSDFDVEVEYTSELKAELLEVLYQMKEARTLEEVHRSHDEPRRCAGCRMREICDEALY
jgi:CRISPR-associated exonuclease Cas4